MAKTDLTAQRLREILNYDPETGQFSWKQPAQGRSSKKIGTKDPGGYLQISVERCVYQAHRLAWLYFYGQWPAAVIDHINRCRTDNRIANLRDVSVAENLQNISNFSKRNRCGYVGVTYLKRENMWFACLTVNGEVKRLGYHHTPELAHDAYVTAKLQYHPNWVW
jgi:hypothetical protein